MKKEPTKSGISAVFARCLALDRRLSLAQRDYSLSVVPVTLGQAGFTSLPDFNLLSCLDNMDHVTSGHVPQQREVPICSWCRDMKLQISHTVVVAQAAPASIVRFACCS